MNATVGTLSKDQQFNNNILNILLTPRISIILFLITAVLTLAFTVVYERDSYRSLVNDWQSMQYENMQLRLTSKQLLIEQSTWGSQVRVQRIAENRLHMLIPDQKHLDMIIK